VSSPSDDRRGGGSVFGRGTAALAGWLGVAALVVASTSLSAAAGASTKTTAAPQLGFNTYVQDLCQSNSTWASDATGQFSELKALGANSIALAFPLYMSTLDSNVVFSKRVCGTDYQTPSPARLKVAIGIAHAMNLRVFLRPLLAPFSQVGGWRGTIRPSNTSWWFKSYFKALAPYLKLAQQQKVQYFAISTELDSMAKKSNWRSLIKEARHLYRGSTIFTIVWAYGDGGKVKWAGTSPGIDAYEAVHLPASATTAEMLASWNLALHTINKVPFSLSSATIDEVAIAAQNGAYWEPWAWALPSNFAFDESVQANWYQMVCNFFQMHKMKGIYFWGIWYADGSNALPSTPSPGLAQEIQPASAQVIKACYSNG
jgi:hypothetical protein